MRFRVQRALTQTSRSVERKSVGRFGQLQPRGTSSAEPVLVTQLLRPAATDRFRPFRGRAGRGGCPASCEEILSQLKALAQGDAYNWETITPAWMWNHYGVWVLRQLPYLSSGQIAGLLYFYGRVHFRDPLVLQALFESLYWHARLKQARPQTIAASFAAARSLYYIPNERHLAALIQSFCVDSTYRKKGQEALQIQALLTFAKTHLRCVGSSVRKEIQADPRLDLSGGSLWDAIRSSSALLFPTTSQPDLLVALKSVLKLSVKGLGSFNDIDDILLACEVVELENLRQSFNQALQSLFRVCLTSSVAQVTMSCEQFQRFSALFLKGRRLLTIEPNPHLSQLVKGYLQHHGHRMTVQQVTQAAHFVAFVCPSPSYSVVQEAGQLLEAHVSSMSALQLAAALLALARLSYAPTSFLRQAEFYILQKRKPNYSRSIAEKGFTTLTDTRNTNGLIIKSDKGIFRMKKTSLSLKQPEGDDSPTGLQPGWCRAECQVARDLEPCRFSADSHPSISSRDLAALSVGLTAFISVTKLEALSSFKEAIHSAAVTLSQLWPIKKSLTKSSLQKKTYPTVVPPPVSKKVNQDVKKPQKGVVLCTSQSVGSIESKHHDTELASNISESTSLTTETLPDASDNACSIFDVIREVHQEALRDKAHVSNEEKALSCDTLADIVSEAEKVMSVQEVGQNQQLQLSIPTETRRNCRTNASHRESVKSNASVESTRRRLLEKKLPAALEVTWKCAPIDHHSLKMETKRKTVDSTCSSLYSKKKTPLYTRKRIKIPQLQLSVLQDRRALWQAQYRDTPWQKTSWREKGRRFTKNEVLMFLRRVRLQKTRNFSSSLNHVEDTLRIRRAFLLSYRQLSDFSFDSIQYTILPLAEAMCIRDTGPFILGVVAPPRIWKVLDSVVKELKETPSSTVEVQVKFDWRLCYLWHIWTRYLMSFLSTPLPKDNTGGILQHTAGSPMAENLTPCFLKGFDSATMESRWPNFFIDTLPFVVPSITERHCSRVGKAQRREVAAWLSTTQRGLEYRADVVGNGVKHPSGLLCPSKSYKALRQATHLPLITLNLEAPAIVRHQRTTHLTTEDALKRGLRGEHYDPQTTTYLDISYASWITTIKNSKALEEQWSAICIPSTLQKRTLLALAGDTSFLFKAPYNDPQKLMCGEFEPKSGLWNTSLLVVVCPILLDVAEESGTTCSALQKSVRQSLGVVWTSSLGCIHDAVKDALASKIAPALWMHFYAPASILWVQCWIHGDARSVCGQDIRTQDVNARQVYKDIMEVFSRSAFIQTSTLSQLMDIANGLLAIRHKLDSIGSQSAVSVMLTEALQNAARSVYANLKPREHGTEALGRIEDVQKELGRNGQSNMVSRKIPDPPLAPCQKLKNADSLLCRLKLLL